jgi:hypothetical protein
MKLRLTRVYTSYACKYFYIALIFLSLFWIAVTFFLWETVAGTYYLLVAELMLSLLIVLEICGRVYAMGLKRFLEQFANMFDVFVLL